MDKSIVLLASTQNNPFKGQNITEGRYCADLVLRVKPLLQSWGWRVNCPWKFDANGDFQELSAQKRDAIALKERGTSFVVSIHCNYTGTTRRDGVMMIYRKERAQDKVWADAFGRICGELTTLGFDKTYDESVTNFKRLAIMDVPGPNILVEIGEFGTAAEAAWLVQYQGKVALALAQAIEQSCHDVYGTPLGHIVLPDPATVIDEYILKSHPGTKINGSLVMTLKNWYNIPPLATLVIWGAETSLGDPKLGGPIVSVHNFGCIKYQDPLTSWGKLQNGKINIRGIDWAAFPSAFTGGQAWGRYFKAGPKHLPGYYMRQIVDVKIDWRRIAEVYYGAEVPKFEEYVTRLEALAARFAGIASQHGVSLF